MPPRPSREPRQAVVLIHGIGEQIPMQTLRSFVHAIAGGVRKGIGFNASAESKPDYISRTLELRRMAMSEGEVWEAGRLGIYRFL